MSNPVRHSITGVLVAFAAVLLSACGEEPASAPALPVPEVTVVTLTGQTVTLQRDLPGRTSPSLVAEVRPQVNGIVKARLFKEGGVVEAGQPLYQLDDALYQAELSSAKAALQQAQAALESARLKSERVTRLSQSGAISQQALDDATAAYLEAKARVAVQEATVARHQVTLDYARITAPVSGRIGKSSVSRGALVTANQAAPLATIQRLDPLYIDLTQSASEWLQLKRQQQAGALQATGNVPVTILLENGDEYDHKGKLTFADVTVNPSTGSFALRTEVPNPDSTLLPGMYVRAIVSTGKRDNAILVPQQGISRDPTGQTFAMVVNPEGLVEKRSVVVNQTIGDRWLVDAGLQAGDRVITEGLQKIRVGGKVVAVESEHDGAAHTAQEAQPDTDTQS
ncbi:efflux RND transporter periplasmic adaptor subunit [Marinobacter sp. X15-166B]|uniref:efflux RND transporter periplasmic adaptor subunit n=1 Tax=Marinobacter sp. X15-166B TaxID=1897620 RepID=UPI00085CB0B6|nr:efflux RND transporter periplasmic adaptor subunit [Marinobacter sp. X15-166B]OEY67911.1 efflux transporter periplasmic adaptor subunit [Marinobacter sp. X15-166B]